MYYTALIDLKNKEVLYEEHVDDKAYADDRYVMHGLTAFLWMRDNPGTSYQAYIGTKPYVFLPTTDDEAAAAMSAADSSGVDALSS